MAGRSMAAQPVEMGPGLAQPIFSLKFSSRAAHAGLYHVRTHPICTDQHQNWHVTGGSPQYLLTCPVLP